MLWFWDSISRRYQYWVKPLITITGFISYDYVMFLICTIRRSLYWTFFFLFLKILFYFLTLQYCVGFAIYQHESATGIHVFLILNPPPSSLPVPSLCVVPVHQPQASSIVHQTWTGNLFHIWYYTCFNAILPNHPTLSLSNRVQKTVLYISVSFAVSYTGLLLPSIENLYIEKPHLYWKTTIKANKLIVSELLIASSSI